MQDMNQMNKWRFKYNQQFNKLPTCESSSDTKKRGSNIIWTILGLVAIVCIFIVTKDENNERKNT